MIFLLGITDSLESRRDELFDKIDNEPEDIVKISNFFANNELVEELKAGPNFNIEYLTSAYGITQEALLNYYKFRYA
jgi:hypothetical protein